MKKWELVNRNPGIPFRSMGSSGSMFVGVGDRGTVMTSTDGRKWTERNPGFAKNLYGITYGNGLFAACGYAGTLLTSPDGINWTKRDSSLSEGLWAIAHSGSLFVVMGRKGAVATSPDGKKWTAGNTGTKTEFRSVCWGNGLFVAAGSSGRIYTSPNGTKWTHQSAPTASNLYSAVFGNGMFVVGGGKGALMSSPDGKTWTKRDPGPGNYFWEGVYVGSKFVLACNRTKFDPSAPVYISSGGKAWKKIYTGSQSHLRGIAAIGSVICAAGDRRTIMYSASASLPPAPEPQHNFKITDTGITVNSTDGAVNSIEIRLKVEVEKDLDTGAIAIGT